MNSIGLKPRPSSPHGEKFRLEALLLVAFIATSARGAGNPRGKVTARVGRATVTIEYGRPSVRGRNVLNLIAPGQLWRLGVDAPTTIQSDVALEVGGKAVPKGKHILLVRYIEPGIWSLVVSKQPAGQYDPASRIAEVLTHFESRPTLTEQVTIQIDNRHNPESIDITWGRYLLIAPFSSDSP
ncbi:MAG: DUF2911 domain-containing protein [Terriglobia bacterium]